MPRLRPSSDAIKCASEHGWSGKGAILVSVCRKSSYYGCGHCSINNSLWCVLSSNIFVLNEGKYIKNESNSMIDEIMVLFEKKKRHHVEQHRMNDNVRILNLAHLYCLFHVSSVRLHKCLRYHFVLLRFRRLDGFCNFISIFHI